MITFIQDDGDRTPVQNVTVRRVDVTKYIITINSEDSIHIRTFATRSNALVFASELLDQGMILVKWVMPFPSNIFAYYPKWDDYHGAMSMYKSMIFCPESMIKR